MEAQRVVRAGDHLREPERRVNASFPDGSRPLRWENAPVDASHTRVSGYGIAIPAVVTTTAVLRPGVGGYLLAQDGAWTGFVAAEAADIAVLAWFARWSNGAFRRLGPALTRQLALDYAPTGETAGGRARQAALR